MTEPQLGGTYEDLLFAAGAAEAAGLAGFSRSDHYAWTNNPGIPATDAFVTLGGLARETKRVRLCILVSPITFRHPAVIAKSATTLDEMSGGRFDLGLGTGWMEAEHDAFGLPFPPLQERFARLEEYLQYLKAAFSGDSFEGQYYSFSGDAQPRPSGLRMIVGGSGPHKTPTLAGRFADEYNHSVIAPTSLAGKIEVMKEAASAAGRNPAEIEISVMGAAMLAPNSKRLDEMMTAAAAFRNIGVTELEERWNASGVPRGTPDQAAEYFAELAAVGVSKYYLQWIDLPDRAGVTEQVELAAQVRL
jgi:alkanesulfonate monooxygenase SsuD/methylene tetrahydromethanopterin reductase-like flavin-dependent oxidoreductase (luciferase family)